MMSTTHIAATTPKVVPPCVSEGVLRGGVVSGGVPSKRWTTPSDMRGASSNSALAVFTKANADQLTHCSIIQNGGGLRTRVEVTHRT